MQTATLRYRLDPVAPGRRPTPVQRRRYPPGRRSEDQRAESAAGCRGSSHDSAPRLLRADAFRPDHNCRTLATQTSGGNLES
jgi:hypothetical protein